MIINLFPAIFAIVNVRRAAFCRLYGFYLPNNEVAPVPNNNLHLHYTEKLTCIFCCYFAYLFVRYILYFSYLFGCVPQIE